MKTITLWVELITYRGYWGDTLVKSGRVRKTLPKAEDGYWVKVKLEVPGSILNPVFELKQS